MYKYLYGRYSETCTKMLLVEGSRALRWEQWPYRIPHTENGFPLGFHGQLAYMNAYVNDSSGDVACVACAHAA